MYKVIRLKLRPLQRIKIINSGKFLRTVFLEKIAEIDIDFANKLNKLDRYWNAAPYAITPIYNPQKHSRWIPIELDLLPENIYVAEFKLVYKVFENYFDELMRGIFETIRIDDIAFKVNGVELKNFREKVKVARSFRVYFRTPTFFRIPGTDKHYLLPTPEKIIYSAMEIWNRFSGCKIERDIIDKKLLPNVEVSDYKIKSVELPESYQEKGSVGFVGYVEYSTSTKEASQLLSKILESATYTNVGENRTEGFGVINYVALD